MTKTVLFVHGTGVRKASFEASAARIAGGLARMQSTARLRPCLWGDAYGAKLGMDGVSIPEFGGPVAAPGDEEENVALWDLLARDSLFELRELAATIPSAPVPPILHQQKQEMLAALAALPDDAAILAFLAPFATHAQWTDAVGKVAGTAEVASATAAARTSLGPLRMATGRSLVAFLQGELADLNVPVLPKAARDELVIHCADALGGAVLGGFLDWFKSRLVGLGLNWATAKARRKRDALFTAAAPTAGDVVMYQARGQAIRDCIEAQIRACDGDVVLLAHSLGGIACVDLLILKDLPQVQGLVTVGTQAPFLYEIDALSALPFSQPLPPHFPARWLNFFDCNDLLSYKAGTVFPGRAEDIEVASGQPFPHAHSAYWDEQVFWDRFAPLLK